MGDDVIKTDYDKNLEELSGMSGLAESAASKEADRLVDKLSTEGDEEDMFTPNEESLGEDVIIPEEVVDEEEKVEVKVEDEEEIEIPDELLDHPEVKKLLIKNKHLNKSNKKLIGKLGKLERKVAWADRGDTIVPDTSTVAPVDDDFSDIFASLGIEDPDEPMTARQTLEFNKEVAKRQKATDDVQSKASSSANAAVDRVNKIEAEFKKDHPDYDEVVNSFVESKKDDVEFRNFILTRDNPAEALYSFATIGLGAAEEDEADPKTLEALKLREEKEATLTIGKSKAAKSRARDGSAVSQAHDMFSRMQTGSDKEREALQEKYGAD
jgi:membrane protein implicated in regulation of membrane protease activity